MKIIITERQYGKIIEGTKISDLPMDQRHKIVADFIIKYMDKNGLVAIPLYSALQSFTIDNVVDGIKIKTFLEKYLRKNEYDNYVKPMIIKMRPDFSYTAERRLGQNNYLVDDNVAVKSQGEVIVYNTFKMNNIKLEYEDLENKIHYLKLDVTNENGENYILKKIPDFYWKERNTYIEIAGIDDKSKLGVNYEYKLKKAQEELAKMDVEMIILDYLQFKNKQEEFYKYVCEMFNFPYDPKKFFLAYYYEGIDKEKYRKIAIDLINKKSAKTRGEQDILNKIIKRYLTKTEVQPDDEKIEVGYKDVWDFKRSTGAGLKWSDEDEKEKIQNCWCKSSGSNMGTYEKYRELYSGEKISKLRIETVKKKFPEDFDSSKREEICQKYND